MVSKWLFLRDFNMNIYEKDTNNKHELLFNPVTRMWILQSYFSKFVLQNILDTTYILIENLVPRYSRPK